jgi:hypothetical protein
MEEKSKMMILEKIITPFERIPERYRDMYFRGKQFSYIQNGMITIGKFGTLQTDTYFNSFSIKKWNRYTRMKDLFLRLTVQGACRVAVRNDYRVENHSACNELESCEIHSDEKTTVMIDLSRHLACAGMISFDVLAHQETVIYEAEYLCSASPEEVNIALAVCTFKRETYIARLIEDYKKSNAKNVSLFISDNGCTLKETQEDGVHIYPNRNYGGAGGFTRCMLEVKRYNKTAEKAISHIVLMDDDILFDLRVVEKMSAFLSILKEEYRTYFVCGAMCSLDEPNLQYERNSRFCGSNNFVQMGAGYNLSDQYHCIINEDDEDQNHFEQCTAGWWFCCFAVDIYKENNYPFPCFFRGDDIEFALRNRSNVITLNGLNVWHEPFYKKFSNTAENYYLPRNLLVVNLLYCPNALEASIGYFKSRMKSCLIQYDYEGAELLNRALKDFFKGPDFFATQDAEALNKELSAYNHKMISFREALGEYCYEDILWQANECSDSSKLVRMIRKITLNGYLIPKRLYKEFRISGVGFRGRPYSYFRRKRVFNADTIAYKGYFTTIQRKRALKLYKEFRENVRFLKKHYSELQQLYTLKFPELQTEEFWVKYLNIDKI